MPPEAVHLEDEAEVDVVDDADDDAEPRRSTPTQQPSVDSEREPAGR